MPTRCTTKLAATLIAFAVIVTACGGSATIDDTPAENEERTVTETTGAAGPVAAQGVLPDGPSALRVSNAVPDEFPEPLVDPQEIISGGPPPDGIPPIEDPVFLTVTENIQLLEDAEAVVALEINGDARAYPVQVMIWHEIVNDTVGGVPVSVTYCPLCNSAVTYRREIQGVETSFGTSGRLFASALVMYDRATESLWTHFDGKAVVGMLTGEQLEAIASPLMSWADFRVTYPDGQVLDPEQTGFSRNYGANPYVGYDDEEEFPFLFRGIVDDRATAKQRVVGVALDGAAKAFSLESISGGDAVATNDSVGDAPIVIFWKSGQATALESTSIGGGRDVGSVAVFSPVVDGKRLTFAAVGDGFVDAETGSTWALSGEALDGELAGAALERIPHLDTFWFAWATYQPGTALVDER